MRHSSASGIVHAGNDEPAVNCVRHSSAQEPTDSHASVHRLGEQLDHRLTHGVKLLGGLTPINQSV